MTRVILTNKKTGQALPEANLIALAEPDDEGPWSYHIIQFDGDDNEEQEFSSKSWDLKEVAPSAVYGDVYRRVDREDSHAGYVVAVHLGTFGWHEINPLAKTIYPIEDIDITHYIGADDGAWERA